MHHQVGVTGSENPVLNSDRALVAGEKTDFWIYIQSSGEKLHYLPILKVTFLVTWVAGAKHGNEHLFVLA